MDGFGPRDHGPTNVIQLTFVFNREGDLKGVSGYERDHQGATYGQWRTALDTDAARAELMVALPEYLAKRLTGISKGE